LNREGAKERRSEGAKEAKKSTTKILCRFSHSVRSVLSVVNPNSVAATVRCAELQLAQEFIELFYLSGRTGSPTIA
jgi:hypothetical protein